MQNSRLIRGVLSIYKFPIFLLAGSKSDVLEKVRRDASRYLRVSPSSLSLFGVFCCIVSNKNLATVFISRIRNRPIVWMMVRFFFSYNNNIEILVPASNIGAGLVVLHNIGAVIRAKSLGEDVTISQGVTIGAGGDWNDTRKSNIPTIGSRVLIATNALVIGEVSVGDDAVIGAGAVITKDIHQGEVVVGNPQRVIKYNMTKL